MCGIFFGISPILSQLRGAKKTDQIPPYIQQSFYIILLLTVFIFILGYFFVDSFLGIMRLDPQVHTIAHNYLIAIGCGIFRPLPSLRCAILPMPWYDPGIDGNLICESHLDNTPLPPLCLWWLWVCSYGRCRYRHCHYDSRMDYHVPFHGLIPMV